MNLSLPLMCNPDDLQMLLEKMRQNQRGGINSDWYNRLADAFEAALAQQAQPLCEHGKTVRHSWFDDAGASRPGGTVLHKCPGPGSVAAPRPRCECILGTAGTHLYGCPVAAPQPCSCVTQHGSKVGMTHRFDCNWGVGGHGSQTGEITIGLEPGTEPTRADDSDLDDALCDLLLEMRPMTASSKWFYHTDTVKRAIAALRAKST